MNASGSPPADIKAKALEYFAQLPADKQAEWNEKYKQECVAWVKTVPH